jgi:hypothetical protein
MVNISAKINKTNRYISHQIAEHNLEKIVKYSVGDPGTGLGHAHTCVGVKSVHDVVIPFSVLKIRSQISIQI